MLAEYGFDMLFNLNENQEFEDYKKPEEIVVFLERSLQENETLELAPKLVLDPTSLDAIKIINEKLDPYVSETSTAFITGEYSIENEWAAYIDELEKRGYTALESIWNDAWDRQNNSD